MDVPTAIFQVFSSQEVKEGEGWHKSRWHQDPRGKSPKTVTPQNRERGSYHGNSQLLGKGKIQRGDPAERLEAEDCKGFARYFPLWQKFQGKDISEHLGQAQIPRFPSGRSSRAQGLLLVALRDQLKLKPSLEFKRGTTKPRLCPQMLAPPDASPIPDAPDSPRRSSPHALCRFYVGFMESPPGKEQGWRVKGFGHLEMPQSRFAHGSVLAQLSWRGLDSV